MQTIQVKPGRTFWQSINRLHVDGVYNKWLEREGVKKPLRNLRTGEISDEEVIEAIRNVPPHVADLSITAANVSFSQTVVTANATAGATITAGQSLYTSATPNLQLAKADTAAHAAVTGVALGNFASGQLVTVATSGTITVSGASFTPGVIIVVSPNNAGGIAPSADLTTGNFLTIMGYVATATTLILSFLATGIAHG